VKAFISLGGNFVRAVPDTGVIEPAWRKLRLTVHIATKPNRSQLIHGEVSYVLPCLGRIEIDRQDGVAQSVSTEDSTGCMHGTHGFAEPASPQLLSEHAIIAGIAMAMNFEGAHIDWSSWLGDYLLIRDAIEKTYPDIFRDFNQRMWEPGGFHRPIAPRHRIWSPYGTTLPAARSRRRNRFQSGSGPRRPRTDARQPHSSGMLVALATAERRRHTRDECPDDQ